MRKPKCKVPRGMSVVESRGREAQALLCVLSSLLSSSFDWVNPLRCRGY